MMYLPLGLADLRQTYEVVICVNAQSEKGRDRVHPPRTSPHLPPRMQSSKSSAASCSARLTAQSARWPRRRPRRPARRSPVNEDGTGGDDNTAGVGLSKLTLVRKIRDGESSKTREHGLAHDADTGS